MSDDSPPPDDATGRIASKAVKLADKPVEDDQDKAPAADGAPHLREWWGDPQTELGHIRDMVEGRDTTRPYIFHVDGEPLGYIQVWYIGHHQNEPWIRDHPWLAALPADFALPVGSAVDTV